MKNEIELLDYLSRCEQKKEYINGLKACELYEHLIEKKYYEFARFKILFLMKTKQYLDAYALIKQELSLPYCPKDFYDFLIDQKKIIDLEMMDLKRRSNVMTREDLNHIDEFDEQTLIKNLSFIADSNLVGLERKFQNLFDNPKIKDYTKTILITILYESKINYRFKVIKEDVLIEFNPLDLKPFGNCENDELLNQKMKEFPKIEHNVFKLIEDMIKMYLYSLYPLIIEEDYLDLIIVSATSMAYEMFNMPLKNDKVETIYASNGEKIKKIRKKMNNFIEGI